MKKSITLGLAAVTTGLNAGLFFAFSVAINPALGKLPDLSYITAMQNINKLIQNPVFFLAFFGAVVFLLWAMFQEKDRSSLKFKLIALAAVFYIIGTFGVTIAKNVPLNDKLAKVSVAMASSEDLTQARKYYEKPWLTWHMVRSVNGVLSLGFVVAACLVSGETAHTKRRGEAT